jgi:hypothetical protein
MMSAFQARTPRTHCDTRLRCLTSFRTCAELLRRLTTLLPEGTLRLSVTITDVQRPPAGAPHGAAAPVLVTYTQPGRAAPHTLRCGALVNTAPQTVQNLAFLRLDAEETALFKRVFANRYYTTALVVRPKPKTEGMYLFMPPVNLTLRNLLPAAQQHGGPAVPLVSALMDAGPFHGQVTSFTTTNSGAANRPSGVSYNADPGLVCAYSYSDVDITPAEVAAKAARALSSGGGGGAARPKRTAEARETFDFVYYPRVGEAALRAGWFDKLEAMQGRRGTYHAGGITTFWDVEQSMRSGQDLVARFF